MNIEIDFLRPKKMVGNPYFCLKICCFKAMVHGAVQPQIWLQLGVQLTANCQSSFKDLDLTKKIWIKPVWDVYPYNGFRAIIHIFLQYIIIKIEFCFSHLFPKSSTSYP
jgi:hypothetical protein